MNTDVNDNHAYLRVTTPTFGPKSQMTFLFQIDSHLSTTSGREEAHTGTHTCPDTFHVSAFEDKIRQEDTPVFAHFMESVSFHAEHLLQSAVQYRVMYSCEFEILQSSPGS